MRSVFLIGGFAMILALAGCAAPAKFIERKETGGIVAVPDYAHRDEGLSLIHHEVGPNYSIVDEKQVEIGSDSKTIVQSGSGTIFTRIESWFTGVKQVAKSETKTEKETEWRITYAITPPPAPSRPSNP